MQTCVAPRSLVAPHSRQERWLAKPNRDGFLVAGVLTGRGLSPSSLPAAFGPRAGVGTCRDEAPLCAAPCRSALRTLAQLAEGQQAARSSRWLPGLHRAVPSTPLDERYEVVPSTLTDRASDSPSPIGLTSRS